MLAFEGDSHAEWFEGNYADYEADRKTPPRHRRRSRRTASSTSASPGPDVSRGSAVAAVVVRYAVPLVFRSCCAVSFRCAASCGDAAAVLLKVAGEIGALGNRQPHAFHLHVGDRRVSPSPFLRTRNATLIGWPAWSGSTTLGVHDHVVRRTFLRTGDLQRLAAILGQMHVVHGDGVILECVVEGVLVGVRGAACRRAQRERWRCA